MNDPSRARLQRIHHGIDLALRLAQSLVELLVEPLAERLFAIAQVLLARLQTGLRLLDDLPLAGNEAARVIEVLHVTLDLCEALGKLCFARGPLRARLFDDRRRQPETARNLQRQAAAWRAVMKRVGA